MGWLWKTNSGTKVGPKIFSIHQVFMASCNLLCSWRSVGMTHLFFLH